MKSLREQIEDEFTIGVTHTSRTLCLKLFNEVNANNRTKINNHLRRLKEDGIIKIVDRNNNVFVWEKIYGDDRKISEDNSEKKKELMDLSVNEFLQYEIQLSSDILDMIQIIEINKEKLNELLAQKNLINGIKPVFFKQKNVSEYYYQFFENHPISPQKPPKKAPKKTTKTSIKPPKISKVGKVFRMPEIKNDTKKTIVLIDLPNIVNSYAYSKKNIAALEHPNMTPPKLEHFHLDYLITLIERYVMIFKNIEYIKIYTTPHYNKLNNLIILLKEEYPINLKIYKKNDNGEHTSDYEDIDDLLIDDIYDLGASLKGFGNRYRLVIFGGDAHYYNPIDYFIGNTYSTTYTIFHKNSFPKKYNDLKKYNKTVRAGSEPYLWNFRYYSNIELRKETDLIKKELIK